MVFVGTKVAKEGWVIGEQMDMTEYGTYIKVGDMRDSDGLTYREIAEKVFPFHYPESGKSQAQQFHKKYRKLVDGGYKDLTYP